MDMMKCEAIPLTCMFKTYVNTIKGSLRICFIKKKTNISTNARTMSGKI